MLYSRFLSEISSKDYRIGLFYFMSAVLVYNIWRLINLL